jgi:hypothetical protein
MLPDQTPEPCRCLAYDPGLLPPAVGTGAVVVSVRNGKTIGNRLCCAPCAKQHATFNRSPEETP